MRLRLSEGLNKLSHPATHLPSPLTNLRYTYDMNKVLLTLLIALPTLATAQDYETELKEERYRAAIARARADRAYHEDLVRSYDYQARVRESNARRIEQEREYDRQSNTIGTFNQAVNSASGIARQVQIMSGRGW